MNIVSFSEDILANVRIEVSKGSARFETFAHITTALPPGKTKRFFKEPGITGRIVRIRNTDLARRALTLCEVKVYGNTHGIGII